jgi:preprotein translocase subunit Sec61beta
MASLSAVVARAGPRRVPRGIVAAGISVAALLAASGPSLRAQAVQAAEYHVKAVFLFNFAQFVDWPPAAFADSQASFVICILGDDPFGDFLDQTVRGEQFHGRTFAVRRYKSADELKTCHILFISEPGAEAVLGQLKDRPVLTVSDDEAFAERGGMIRFITDHGRIKLEINPTAAEAANLTISSKLLRVALIATPRGH